MHISIFVDYIKAVPSVKDRTFVKMVEFTKRHIGNITVTSAGYAAAVTAHPLLTATVDTVDKDKVINDLRRVLKQARAQSSHGSKAYGFEVRPRKIYDTYGGSYSPRHY